MKRVLCAFMVVLGSAPVVASAAGDAYPSAAVRGENRDDRTVAQVLAIDRELGKLLLGTDAGAVTIDVPRDELARLKPGDTVMVRRDELEDQAR